MKISGRCAILTLQRLQGEEAAAPLHIDRFAVKAKQKTFNHPEGVSTFGNPVSTDKQMPRHILP